MKHTSLLTAAILLFLGACKHAPEIEAVCENSVPCRYTIKWDITPELDGVVKIYASTRPESFNLREKPVAQVPISDKICEVSLDGKPDIRYYFSLRFNNRYNHTVATRVPNLKSRANFRDIGGYKNAAGKSIRWGQVFRTGVICPLDEEGTKKFQSLQVNTWIDFRDSVRYIEPDSALCIKNIYHLPINLITSSRIFEQLGNEKLRRGDANVFMQNLFIDLAEKGIPTYRKMFELLADKKNYPVVLCDKYGKDYVGFAVALLLSALEVPEETIYSDFLFSNRLLDRCSIDIDRDGSTSDTQEAATALMTTQKLQLSCALHHIEAQYGSIQRYLQEELYLTPEKQARLQSILLH